MWRGVESKARFDHVDEDLSNLLLQQLGRLLHVLQHLFLLRRGEQRGGPRTPVKLEEFWLVDLRISKR